jgi:hypothetical protein
MATKKQSRAKVQGLVNPRGVTAVYGTPIDFKALPEKITIGRRVANGKFKLEAHYPAKHFNDKQTYVDKRKEGSYCRFYDKKSPFFIARTVWDATSQPGMHMIVKNRGETHRFIVTPKVDDPTKASVIGSYLVHRDNGDPVLCSGVIGELEAAGDDGDFKVTPYQNHGIRCPKFDSDKDELAGHIPKTFEYKKSTKPRGPRKTAADYCKPAHTFQHPTDIKKAEMIADMDDEMDEAVSCLNCRWDGSYEDLVFVDADGSGGGGYDFHLVCPVCEDDEWLDDMMAESVDEPCFSCDGIGHWDDGDCGYCAGSGLMSDTLRAEMAMFNNEYFDADCGCFKKAEGLTDMNARKLVADMEASLSVWDITFVVEDEEGDQKLYTTNSDYDHSFIADSTEMDDLVPVQTEDAETLFRKAHYAGAEGLTGEEYKGESFGADFVPLNQGYWCSWCGDNEKSSLPKNCINYHYHYQPDNPSCNNKMCVTCYNQHQGRCYPCSHSNTSIEQAAESFGAEVQRVKMWRCEGCQQLYYLKEDAVGCCYDKKAETFEAPYAGAGALMGIKGDSALSSFTPSELTESSAIHGDFDQASLNYSGHQNLEVRAEYTGGEYDDGEDYISSDHSHIYGKVNFTQGEGRHHTANFNIPVRDFLIKNKKHIEIERDVYGAESHDEVCEYGNPLFVLKGHTHGYCVEPSCENSYCVTERKNEWSAETLGKDSCCCGATKSKPCACMKTGAKCSGSCACSTKEARAESLVWCEHDNYENYDARWVNNVRIDSYKCKTCGMENDKEQHLDQDLFNQAEREGYKLYDYGEWEQDEPYKYEKDGIIIEIPVVKEEDIYRLDSPKTPPKWAKPLGLIGGLAAGYISAQMIDNTKE